METYKDHITLSPDMNEERLNTLRELFPDWFTQEGRLDINEVKKAVNPDSVEETERYEFRWFGKSAAGCHLRPRRCQLRRAAQDQFGLHRIKVRASNDLTGRTLTLFCPTPNVIWLKRRCTGRFSTLGVLRTGNLPSSHLTLGVQLPVWLPLSYLFEQQVTSATPFIYWCFGHLR